MNAPKCPVAALASDFAVAIATMNDLDERVHGSGGEALAADRDAFDAAWDRIYDLQEAALKHRATSPTGLAVQVTVAHDELVQLETMDLEADEREAKFKAVRSVLRSVLMTLDPRVVGQTGIVELYIGQKAAAEFRKNIGPKPS